MTLISQGCRLNHAESAGLINDFKNEGYTEVGLNESPDIVVINTCTVTENGDKDTVKLVNKINKQNNQAKIALIGCQSEIKKAKLLELTNVKWVIGNDLKQKTKDIILTGKNGVHVTKIQKQPFFQDFSSFDPKHTRVNLKIQDGCDFFCAFCIIPFARGPARSRDFNNIINDATALIQLGVKEIVLTGINLGTYENNGFHFYDLLEKLLSLNKNTRIRISSIEPTTIDDRLIALWKKYANFCRYLHLPIQSATNTILAKMRRKYTVEMYDEFIKKVRLDLPDMCIGTDVIVGFPGETNELFDQTEAYLKASEINYFHVFSYSERTMAHSRKFKDPVEKNIIKDRSLKLRQLHDQKWRSFLSSKIGQSSHVLFEQKKGDHWIGSTEHFIKVKLISEHHIKNKMIEVKLTKVMNNEMIGTEI